MTKSTAKVISLPVNEATTQITWAVSGEHNILVYILIQNHLARFIPITAKSALPRMTL
jgi:hypothetical protein